MRRNIWTLANYSLSAYSLFYATHPNTILSLPPSVITQKLQSDIFPQKENNVRSIIELKLQRHKSTKVTVLTLVLSKMTSLLVCGAAITSCLFITDLLVSFTRRFLMLVQSQLWLVRRRWPTSVPFTQSVPTISIINMY